VTFDRLVNFDFLTLGLCRHINSSKNCKHILIMKIKYVFQKVCQSKNLSESWLYWGAFFWVIEDYMGKNIQSHIL
jgi:hypothetical protein